MSMAVGNIHNTYTTYQAQKTSRKNLSTTETSREDYVKELQEKNPQINIAAGNPDRNTKSSYTGKTDVRIAPQFLDKMMSDPQTAAKYEDMLSKIPALDRWANSMIKAMTGSEVKYRQVWIDENGNMGSMCITGPSEKQKKAAAERKKSEQKSFEEHIEKLRENAKERAEQLEKIFERNISNSRNGELFFNHADIQLLIQSVGNQRASGSYLDRKI